MLHVALKCCYNWCQLVSALVTLLYCAFAPPKKKNRGGRVTSTSLILPWAMRVLAVMSTRTQDSSSRPGPRTEIWSLRTTKDQEQHHWVLVTLPRGAKYCDQSERESIYKSVCKRIFEITHPNFTNFVHVRMAGSVAIRYVLPVPGWRHYFPRIGACAAGDASKM